MRSALQLGLVLALASGAAFGQRPPVIPLGNPLPQLSPIPPLGGSPRPPFAPQRGPQRRLASPGYSPVLYYPTTAYDAPAEPAPGVTIIQQFAPPPPVAAQEQPVTPQIHEYPALAAPPPGAEQATFAIVLKDGSSLTATAVMVQGKELQIVDPDGGHRRIPLDSIDRDATRRRNAERNLRLQLPY